jgi:hypothetical protein
MRQSGHAHGRGPDRHSPDTHTAHQSAAAAASGRHRPEANIDELHATEVIATKLVPITIQTRRGMQPRTTIEETPTHLPGVHTIDQLSPERHPIPQLHIPKRTPLKPRQTTRIEPDPRPVEHTIDVHRRPLTRTGNPVADTHVLEPATSEPTLVGQRKLSSLRPEKSSPSKMLKGSGFVFVDRDPP